MSADQLAGGVLAGTTSLSLPAVLRKTSDNTEQTAKVAADMTVSYWRQGGIRVAVTASDLAAVNSAYSSGGVKEVDATNMPGLYRADWPDAAFATGAAWVVLAIKVGSDYVYFERFALTTNVVQSGDNFARIGAPAAASISADIAANKALISARTGTAQAGAAGTITLDASASATTDFYVGMQVFLTGGTGAGQARVVTAYNGGTKVATIAPNWATNPDNTSVFAVLPFTQNTGVQGSITGSVGSVTGAVGSVTGAVGSVTGAVGSVTGNVGGNVVGSVASVTGAVGSVTARVTANTDQLAGQTVTAAAGVTFPSSVASPTNISAGTITTVTNLTNAPTAGDLTATMKTSVTTAATAATPTAAAVTGAVGSVTGNVGGNVVGSVASVTADVGITQAGADKVWGTTVRALTDKVGFALSSAGVQAIWDALTSALTTAGSIGKWIIDKLDVVVSTRLATSGYTAPLDAAGTRTAVGLATANLDTQLGAIPGATWDVTLSGHLTAGTTGNALNAAGAAGDPWSTALPGAYGSGTAGNIVGNRLDAAITTRTKPADTQAAVTAVVNDVGITQAAADKVWGTTVRTLSSFGTLVADVATAVWGAAVRVLTAGTNIVLAKGVGVTGFNDPTAAATATAVRTELATELARIDVATSTRLASGSYVAPDNAGISTAVAGTIAIFARTDVATSSRAAPGDPMALTSGERGSMADKVLGRSIVGGADGGRTVKDALKPLRNRTRITGGTLEVYEDDDTTVAWSGPVTTAPGDPLVEMNPT